MTTENAVLVQNSDEYVDISKAAKYESEYGDYMEIAADAMKTKYEYDWTPQDTLAFGQYADTWSEYRPMLESDLTSRNTLGPALSSNMGLIAMSYAALPIQNLASVQPLQDEAGTIFFRKGIATSSRGGVNAGDDLLNPYGAINSSIGDYSSETQVKTVPVSATGVAPNVGPYTIQLGAELRPGATRISVAGGKIKGLDDGEGHILGVGIDSTASTINYTTGVMVLKFLDPTQQAVIIGDSIDTTYHQSVIDSNTIPTMKWVLTSKVVNVDYYVLQSQYSNLSEMVLRKRFGAELSDQITADLVSQITASVMYKTIAQLRSAAIRNEVKLGTTITWSFTAPAGVSDFDHRRTFDDKLSEAVANMYTLAGKGDVSAIIVGARGKIVLRSAGMRIIKNSVSGPHLCGMYDSVPVYYAPNTVLGNNEMLIIYRGQQWFESALTYAPFLPVTTVSGRAVNNVLTNASAAYHSAAIAVVQDAWSQRISLV